jgi:hypothetical protein
MVDEPGRVSTWTLRVVVYGGLLAGVGMVIAAARSDDPPQWWWWVGIPLTLMCGSLVAVWIRMRLRFRSKEERQRYFAQLEARRRTVGEPLDRSRLAYRATRHKKTVLRDGQDASAVVTFLADGHRANEFRQLVYLELEVTPPDGGEAYQVRTGEFLNAASTGSMAPGRQLWVKVDPADRQRVAVDWDRSLRLS